MDAHCSQRQRKSCLSLQMQNLFLNTANSLLLPLLLKRFPGYFHIPQACSDALSPWLSCDTVRRHLQITSVFWRCLKFSASVSQSGTRLTPAATVDAGCASDAYPQGQPMLASTFCPGTGRRTWHLPYWFWLSYLHQSAATKWRLHLILQVSVAKLHFYDIIEVLGVQISMLKSYHHTLAVEIVAGDHWFKRVQEGHSRCNVQCKLHCLCLVHNKVWQHDKRDIWTGEDKKKTPIPV